MELSPIRLLSQLPPTAMTGRQQWLHMAFSFLIVISGMCHANFWPTRKVWLCWCTAVGQEELTFVHVEKASHSGQSHWASVIEQALSKVLDPLTPVSYSLP